MAAARPADVARLFWDTDPEQVDLLAHRDYVMERVMSRGSWTAMRWLRDTYSTDEMTDFLVRKGHRLAPRELAYWSLIAGIEISPPRGGARPPWAGCLRERDQEDARKAQEASDTEWNGRLRELERAHAAKEKTSDTTIRNLKGMLERAAAKMRQDDATQLVLRNQINVLQQQLAQERSAKESAGVLGGLFGIALGRAMD